MGDLLAVDLGVRCGLALFGDDGRLRWYRSSNFGSRARLRRGAHGVLAGIEALDWLVGEGDRGLMQIWARPARKQGARTRMVSAETWRRQLLIPREQRSGLEAKRNAFLRARRVIEWSGAPRPTSLRHDAAEAILIGLWAVIHIGWLDPVPDELRATRPKER